jgi:hypothetical protein
MDDLTPGSVVEIAGCIIMILQSVSGTSIVSSDGCRLVSYRVLISHGGGRTTPDILYVGARDHLVIG